MRKLTLTIIFLLLIQSFCISQNAVNKSLTFSAAFQSADSLSTMSIKTTLKNNSGDTLYFVSSTCPENINYTLEGKTAQLVTYDCLITDHPIKVRLLPYGTFEDIVLVTAFSYPPEKFSGSFKLGFKFIQLKKSESPKAKEKLLHTTKQIIWSNEVRVN